jgi:hypothetical protein
MRKLIVALGVVAVTAIGFAPSVGAQSPPPPTATSSSNSLGNIAEGETETFQACGFQPGSTVTKTFNGQSAGTRTADASGCTTETVTVLSDGVAAATPMFAVVGVQLAQTGAPQVRIDGQVFTALVGTNTIVDRGTGLNGQPRTVTTTFTIQRAGAGTGAGAGGGGAGQGTLVRTGELILRWSLVAVALGVIGFLLVLVSKRRERVE